MHTNKERAKEKRKNELDVERKEMSICECCTQFDVHTLNSKETAPNVLHRVEHVRFPIVSAFQNQLNQFTIERFLYQMLKHTHTWLTNGMVKPESGAYFADFSLALHFNK